MSKQKFSPKSVREKRASLRKTVLRVLVVENHPDTREGIQLFLKALGYQATATGSMAEALALSEREQFDLLLSDITLPDGDGWRLLAALQAYGREPRHAIAMSGLSGSVEQARSRAAGYTAHLVKPFSPQELEKVLHRVADELAPSVVAAAPTAGHQDRLRQRLHDGLCQQLAASSLLQAALVNRLVSLDESSETATGIHGKDKPMNGAKSVLSEVVDEARRIGQLIHETLAEMRAIMQELEPVSQSQQDQRPSCRATKTPISTKATPAA